jgi:formylglycine-generating enzyme required for sulfatase activity
MLNGSYPWGDDFKLNGQAMANCMYCGSKWDDRQTAPVGSFPPNKFGLYDMVGNVVEWTEDCYHDSYHGAPINGSAWLADDGGYCNLRAVHGASWNFAPASIRSANRGAATTVRRDNDLGFQVARTLLTP